MKTRIVMISLILSILLAIFTGCSFTETIEKVTIEEVKDSVVMIEVYNDNSELIGTGSGFCTYKNNWIVTNFHVIEGAREITIITDEGEKYAVTAVILFNKKEDLAILEMEGMLAPLTLGDGDNIHLKDKVTTIGSPMGERNTVSEGIISNADDNKAIRISAPISHGSSGGVLLDDNYHVIGVTSAGYDEAQNLNFAININVLNSIYAEFKEMKVDVLTATNYSAYAPDITDFNTDNELEMLEKSSIGSHFNSTTTDMEAFFWATDPCTIFDSEMNKISFTSNSFRDRYNRFDKEEKNLAAEYYTYLLQYETRTEIDPEHSALLGKISDWTVEEFIMELDIMKTYELAIMMVELEGLISNGIFRDYLNESSLGYESCILLNRLFDKTDDRYNEDIIDFLNNDDRVSYEQEVDLLEYLGMTVDEEGNVFW